MGGGRGSGTCNGKIFYISRNIQISLSLMRRGFWYLQWYNFINFPKHPNSYFPQWGRGVLVLAIVKFSKCPKRSKSSLSLMGRGWGVLVLAMVKFSKSPKTSKSLLSLMGEGGVPNLHFSQWGRGSLMQAWDLTKIFHSVEHRALVLSDGAVNHSLT